MSKNLLPSCSASRSKACGANLRLIPPASQSVELNLRIFAPLGRYIEATHGTETLARIAAQTGVEVEDLKGRSVWVSHAQAEELLTAAREILPDEEEFKRACIYEIKKAYGPLIWVVRALTPQLVFATACKTIGLVSRISRYEMLESSSNHARVQYHSTVNESRSMCLSRQAQFHLWPTFYGLPAATLTERSCIARGDSTCEYEIRWFESRRWYPAVLGALVGGVPLGIALLTHHDVDAFLALLPVLGATLAQLLEVRRANNANLEIGGKTAEALRDIARQESETRLELLALSARQTEWSRMMEIEVAERTLALDRIVARLAEVEKARQRALRGFSHDLRNPLTAIALQHSYLKENAPSLDGELAEVLEEQEQALGRMRTMLSELMTLTESERWLGRVNPVEVSVELLTEELRRRIRALVHGRPIRTSVFATREAPRTVQTDRMLLDRVVDNLLTNAAKYTQKGSIIIELDGTPGFLTLKVSDTGRGIGEEDIQKVFRPGGSDASRRAENSFGVGLSVVVQILGQIGGRLEVMSLQNTGTTFWAHFPVELPANARVSLQPGDPAASMDADAVFHKVVTIRKSTAR